MRNRFSLNDMCVVVTGAAGGIGQEIVRALAAEGCQLVLLDSNEAALEDMRSELTESGGPFTLVPCDVASEEEIEGRLRSALRLVGGVGGLVNCAGITRQRPMLKMSAAEWSKVISVNLEGTFLVAREVAQQMVHQQSGGSIVNIGSIHGLRAPAVHASSAYAASKGGVVALTRACAAEWGRHGIRVNTVCPGFVETNMTKGPLSDQEYADKITSRTLLGRLGQPDDIVSAVWYLLSPAASYVTGQALAVDGGWTAI